MRCCLCGRSMFAAAVMIGNQPVGPTCAKKAGLMELARKQAGSVRLTTQRKTENCQKTLDLFEELD